MGEEYVIKCSYKHEMIIYNDEIYTKCPICIRIVVLEKRLEQSEEALAKLGEDLVRIIYETKR